MAYNLRKIDNVDKKNSLKAQLTTVKKDYLQ